MAAFYAHSRLGDLDLDASYSGSAKSKNQRYMLSATNQAISSKLATTIGHFFTWPWPWLCKRLYDLSRLFLVSLHCMVTTDLKIKWWLPVSRRIEYKVATIFYHKRFLGNVWSHHRQIWHSDCPRHENASRFHYIDLVFHSRSHRS